MFATQISEATLFVHFAKSSTNFTSYRPLEVHRSPTPSSAKPPPGPQEPMGSEVLTSHRSRDRNAGHLLSGRKTLNPNRRARAENRAPPPSGSVRGAPGAATLPPIVAAPQGIGRGLNAQQIGGSGRRGLTLELPRRERRRGSGRCGNETSREPRRRREAARASAQWPLLCAAAACPIGGSGRRLQAGKGK